MNKILHRIGAGPPPAAVAMAGVAMYPIDGYTGRDMILAAKARYLARLSAGALAPKEAPAGEPSEPPPALAAPARKPRRARREQPARKARSARRAPKALAAGGAAAAAQPV
jgi:hypothetical protein